MSIPHRRRPAPPALRPFASSTAALLAALLAAPAPVLANPSGGQVRSGSATITGQGTGRVDVHQHSDRAILSWDSFNVEAGEVTQFHQPGRDSVAINRIFQGDASRILGSLQANGHVYIVNPHGVLFGRDARVNVQGLIATTTLDGTKLRENEFDPSSVPADGAKIVNQGRIETGAGGFVYLVAPYVRNGKDGVIVSPEGQVKIEAGATVFLADRTDGQGFAVEFTAPAGGEAVNLGTVMADGGLARLRAEVVTQGGVVQADTVREKNGVIELVASDTLTLAGGSQTRARGEKDVAGSSGGTVDAWSDRATTMESGAVVDVSARARGGDGGFAEVSAAKTMHVAGTFAAGAGAGGRAGEIVIDPEQLVIDANTLFSGAGSVTLQADRQLAVASGARIDLAARPGDGRSARQTLRMESGGDVVFARDALIEDSGTGPTTWDVDLVAGKDGAGDLVFEGGGAAPAGLLLARGNVRGVAADDVVLADGTVLGSVEGDVDVEAGGDVVFEAGRTPGVDTLIQSGSGDVRVVAGGSVLLQRTFGGGGNAAIRTTGVIGTDGEGRTTKSDGGDVLVWAKTGDVDAGVGNRWLEPGPNFLPNGPERDQFGFPPGPEFDPIPVVSGENEGPANLGNQGASDGILGIGTEAGGSVVVIAGGNVATRETAVPRSGGTASGAGASYDGAHIGAFGVPVRYEPDGSLDYRGAVPLDGAPENRVIVIAGGDVTGDYVVRNGEATLLAGYELPAGVDTVADLAQLGLDDPVSVRRDALRQDLEISTTADANRNAGWVGTLSKPITVDLIEGSVDLLGRNGVAVRAVENPSLVYPPTGGSFGTAKAPTYADDSFALLESEAGDVVLIGNDAVLPNESGQPALNSLVWLLPPSLTVKTGEEAGRRPGDFVQLEDFTLFPSSQGGLTIDVAGEVRTATGVASGSAQIDILARTTGSAADLSFSIPAGSLLRDPQTGLTYTLTREIAFGPRLPAMPATVNVTFESQRGLEDQQIVIPAGTRVEDYNGNVFVAASPGLIPALADRFSEGEVRFVPEGGAARLPIAIGEGTLLSTPGGALFEVVGGANLNVGDRAVNLSVRALPTSLGVDAQAGELQLVTPIPGIGSATNRLATQRPARAEVLFVAEVPGPADRSDLGRIRALLDPVPGAMLAYAEAPRTGGGSPTGAEGQVLTQPIAQATVVGPVGEIRDNRPLELVDPRILPSNVDPSQVEILAGGLQNPAGLAPAVLKTPGTDGRPDLTPGQINEVSPQDVWQRTTGSFASLKQSDADPAFDGRNVRAGFDYALYYDVCRSGASCASVLDPLTIDESLPLLSGRGPTHTGDREPASLRAGLGFTKIEFELAEAATLLAGPAEGEVFSGRQANLVDVGLITQHANPGDVTSVLVPYGDALFAAEPEELRDRATGLTTTVLGNPLSGVTVSGPGSLVIQVGVQGSGAAAKATGVGGRLALSAVAIGDSSARGIETIGNLVNASLPVGSAGIEVTTAGNVELNDRGAIDTLQGGDITLTSLGGALVGGQPDPSFTAKRGIFTLFVPGAGQDAAASGGGSISIDVLGDFDIGKSVTAALSGGNIVLRSRTGSISAGSAEPFEILGVSSSPTSNLPEVRYTGGGIFASSGRIDIVADKDVDIGAGIVGGSIAIAAGGNILAGQGSISSSGNISIDAGGTISGSIQASGSISIGSGTVSQGADIGASGLVVGAGAVASNTGAGKVSAETAVASSSATSERDPCKDNPQDPRCKGLSGGAGRRSGVSIEVTSQPST